jgi:Zn-finger domain-containing protein
MFQKEFVVVNRKEKINTRMRDFLALLGLSDRLVSEVNDIERLAPIDYKEVSKVIKEKTELSKEYLNRVLAGRFRD